MEKGSQVLVFDRYRFGGNGVPGLVLKTQKRDGKEPEAYVEIFPEEIGLPWPPNYEKHGHRKSWYCFRQLAFRLEEAAEPEPELKFDSELAGCAKCNFENFEKAFPMALRHPYYVIAKGQLNEALGDGTSEEFMKKHTAPIFADKKAAAEKLRDDSLGVPGPV